MSVFAVARDRCNPRVVHRVSGWPRYDLRRAALADVVCAIAGVLIARPGAILGDLFTRFAIRKRLAPPDEAAKYAGHTRRRLEGQTRPDRLWQVSGQSGLSWEESAHRVLTDRRR